MHSEYLAMFVCCILSGFIAGLLFDVNRALRVGLKLKKSAPIADIAYWIAVVVLCYKILFASGDGQLRGFCFMGIAVGAVCYITSFSKTIEKQMVISVRGIKRFFEKLNLPICRVFERILKIYDEIVQNLQKKGKIFGKKTLEKFKKIV